MLSEGFFLYIQHNRYTSLFLVMKKLSCQFFRLQFQGLGEVATPKTLDDGNHLNEMLNFSSSGEDIYDRFINPKFKVFFLSFLISI